MSQNSIDQIITSRMSARAFTQQAVAKELIEQILYVASRAPSGTNTQPWKAYVLQGNSRDQLVEKVCKAHNEIRQDPSLAKNYQEEYDYYPTQWVSPYIDRRRENGWGLYGLLGIGKADKDKMHEQHQRNYQFFDAPVGLMFTVDKVMGRGSLLDYGMFLENLAQKAFSKSNPFQPPPILTGSASIFPCFTTPGNPMEITSYFQFLAASLTRGTSSSGLKSLPDGILIRSG